jgi:pimeloyl-ACP methyl ester carboxylesterase
MQHDMVRRTIPWKIAALAAVVLLAGCASPYRKLSASTDVPRLSRLERHAATLPGRTYRIPVEGREGDLRRLTVEEIGEGDGERLVVLLHGVLSDRTTWRYVAGDLGRSEHLMLVDLLGCGESDRPDPEVLGPHGYGATAQARRVLQALRTRIRWPDAPARLALVGHSLGGAVILRMLGDPELQSDFADVVERVDRVVLLSPLDFAVEKVHPTFDDIAKLGRTKVGLARMLGLLGREVTHSSLDAFADSGLATREDARRLADILKRRESRRPAQAMLRQAVPFHEKTRRPDWERIDELEADYVNVDVPTLILWGERDETLPVSMGYKLQAQLPDARLTVVKESMHSLQLERPGLTARLIREFLVEARDGSARLIGKGR